MCHPRCSLRLSCRFGGERCAQGALLALGATSLFDTWPSTKGTEYKCYLHAIHSRACQCHLSLSR